MISPVTVLRCKTTVQPDGRVVVTGVPLAAGDEVEVVVLHAPAQAPLPPSRYPLRGLPITYHNPSEPAIDPDDWEMNR